VVAPDYRLSVFEPYPAAFDDACRTLVWMHDNAAELRIRQEWLVVGGESAGGGLAAAVALHARDTGDVPVAFQMPLYPMLDDRMNTGSARGNDAPVWNTRSSRNAWRLYLDGRYRTPDVPAYAAPARAADLAGLPPVATFVGELDPFRDETIAYVDRLRAAGVPAALQIVPGAFHGFDAVAPRASISRNAFEFLTNAFRSAGIDTV
jgi:acetyl esterase/lipase